MNHPPSVRPKMPGLRFGSLDDEIQTSLVWKPGSLSGSGGGCATPGICEDSLNGKTSKQTPENQHFP